MNRLLTSAELKIAAALIAEAESLEKKATAKRLQAVEVLSSGPSPDGLAIVEAVTSSGRRSASTKKKAKKAAKKVTKKKVAKKKNRLSVEEKKNVVKYVCNFAGRGGKAAAARKFGVSPGSVDAWVKKYPVSSE